MTNFSEWLGPRHDCNMSPYLLMTIEPSKIWYVFTRLTSHCSSICNNIIFSWMTLTVFIKGCFVTSNLDILLRCQTFNPCFFHFSICWGRIPEQPLPQRHSCSWCCTSYALLYYSSKGKAFQSTNDAFQSVVAKWYRQWCISLLCWIISKPERHSWNNWVLITLTRACRIIECNQYFYCIPFLKYFEIFFRLLSTWHH